MDKKYKLILFDVDGTLLDTSEGIYNSVRFAEKKMNFPPISDEQLAMFVGPPPKYMYQKVYGVGEEPASEAAKYHRLYGREKAIYEAKLYPGVINTLTALKHRGFLIGVATLKLESIANQILQHFGIREFFDVVVGMDTSESMTKAMTICKAMETTGVHETECLMIGDSEYDLEGAIEARVAFLGVTYGFGFRNGIRHGAFIDRIDELMQYV